MDTLEIRLKALTPLWTGGIDQDSDRLHETGLIGSLRWWYEALLRGLGAPACDPIGDDRCPDANGARCLACELFGCTGWQRKFRLRALNAQGEIAEAAIAADTTFALQFLPLRPLRDEERALLALAVRIAARHGALGGKTTLKPQGDDPRGKDYGIVQWVRCEPPVRVSGPRLRAYLSDGGWRVTTTDLPDLRWFFFVHGAFLDRLGINDLLGLSADGQHILSSQPHQRFLRGRRGGGEDEAVSKKIFSFQADGGRLWGYGQNAAMRDKVIAEVRALLGAAVYAIKTGEEVLDELGIPH